MDYMLYGLIAIVVLSVLYFLYTSMMAPKHVSFEEDAKDANVCSTTCDGDEVCMKCPN